jgi:excisionase family DNA binding protein
MASRLLSTGQAARYCSVTPDTILKWIRSGFLPAQITAGGHHRINERDLQRVLRPSTNRMVELEPAPPHRAFRYCWEFNGNGHVLEACKSCPVYQMRAQRCYEVVRLAPEVGHPKVFCKRGSCAQCDYYQQVHGQSVNVLVVSDDRDLTKSLHNQSTDHNFNLEITDCEYSCSAVINEFRPDFAIIDCSMGAAQSRDMANHLTEDPRVPFVHVILAGNEGEFPTECDKEVFARIQRPFNVDDIADCIRGAREGALGA